MGGHERETAGKDERKERMERKKISKEGKEERMKRRKAWKKDA